MENTYDQRFFPIILMTLFNPMPGSSQARVDSIWRKDLVG
jgi:hypothetical protein